MDEPNPWTGKPQEFKVNLMDVWDWVRGRKRRKLREWLADNRKRRRQNLHYEEPEITESESELYDEMNDRV